MKRRTAVKAMIIIPLTYLPFQAESNPIAIAGLFFRFIAVPLSRVIPRFISRNPMGKPVKQAFSSKSSLTVERRAYLMKPNKKGKVQDFFDVLENINTTVEAAKNAKELYDFIDGKVSVLIGNPSTSYVNTDTIDVRLLDEFGADSVTIPSVQIPPESAIAVELNYGDIPLSGKKRFEIRSGRATKLFKEIVTGEGYKSSSTDDSNLEKGRASKAFDTIIQ